MFSIRESRFKSLRLDLNRIRPGWLDLPKRNLRLLESWLPGSLDHALGQQGTRAGQKANHNADRHDKKTDLCFRRLEQSKQNSTTGKHNNDNDCAGCSRGSIRVHFEAMYFPRFVGKPNSSLGVVTTFEKRMVLQAVLHPWTHDILLNCALQS